MAEALPRGWPDELGSSGRAAMISARQSIASGRLTCLIGADLLSAGEGRYNHAVAAHHEDTEKTSLMAILVQICDALSASRPGARSETTELYLRRLEQLEAIGNAFEGVENCFAIQAGRELRVIVQPEKITENEAAVMARDMAERIEKEMRYPGQIRVSVIRETRSIDYAK